MLAAPEPYLIADPRAFSDPRYPMCRIGRAVAHRKILVKTNAYLKWGGWAEMKGFGPVDLETPIIQFAGNDCSDWEFPPNKGEKKVRFIG